MTTNILPSNKSLWYYVPESSIACRAGADNSNPGIHLVLRGGAGHCVMMAMAANAPLRRWQSQLQGEVGR